MKRWFINRLESEESLTTLDGQRFRTLTSKSLHRPKSLSRHRKKPNLLPEIELTLGSFKGMYQLQLTDLKHYLAITKRDWNHMNEHQIVENALAYEFLNTRSPLI